MIQWFNARVKICKGIWGAPKGTTIPCFVGKVGSVSRKTSWEGLMG